MPLQEARLTTAGFQPSPEALTDLGRQAATMASPPGSAAQARPAAARRTAPKPTGPCRSTADGSHDLPPAPPDGTHHAFKYESRPPWTSPDTWRPYCETCSRTPALADLKANPITHIVPTATPSPTTGQLLVSYTRYRGPGIRIAPPEPAPSGNVTLAEPPNQLPQWMTSRPGAPMPQSITAAPFLQGRPDPS